MAIQNRRGVYADFDPTKLMPGEFAVVMEDDPDGTSGAAVYMCFGNSIVKRLIGAEDIQDILDVPIGLGQGAKSIIESEATSAGGDYSHAEGYQTQSSGNRSHAEGSNTKSTSAAAHAEGWYTTAAGAASHAEGSFTNATGEYSHAEGYSADATGYYAHAEGNDTEASGDHSHAEGYKSTSSGQNSHAEGAHNTASGPAAHSEGYYTTASGYYSHAEGYYTISKQNSQHVFGKYNVADPSSDGIGSQGTYVEIVGNGTADNARSNARTLDWSGNEVLAGKLTLGAGPTANMDAATKQYVDNAVGGVSQVSFSDPNSDGNVVISFS